MLDDAVAGIYAHLVLRVFVWWVPSWMMTPKWPADGSVFISHYEIEQPRSVRGDGYWLHYLGTIEYRI